MNYLSKIKLYSKQNYATKLYKFGIVYGFTYIGFIITREFMFSSKLAIYFRREHDKSVLKYISTKYKNIIEKYRNLSTKPIATIPQNCPIWIFWWQGEYNMPPMIRCCLNSIRTNANGHPVIVVSQKNIGQYLSIPKHISEKKLKNIISFAHYSDYVRMALIYEHGGVWLDASILLTAPLTYNEQSEFVSTRNLPLKDCYVPNYRKWNIFYLGAAKGNPLFGFMKDILSQYWFNEDVLIDYFFTDYCMRTAYDNFPAIKEMIDSLPSLKSSIYDVHSLLGKLHDAYDSKWWRLLLQNVHIHKTTFKGNLQDKTKDGEDSFYAYIKKLYL